MILPSNERRERKTLSPWQAKMHQVIFEADTSAGKAFDIILLIFILLSMLTVFLESIEEVRNEYGRILYLIEWFFTIVFTIEYVARISCVLSPLKYAKSFLGIIDFLSIIPTYLSVFIAGSQTLIIIRVIRLLRVFRIFKLAHFLGEAHVLTTALKASRAKITVFLIAVLCIVTIMGTIMYLLEGPENGFTSIPQSIYWCIVTLTTVGYGDITPATALGKTMASLLMITGYGIIAVPTGIVTTELVKGARKEVTTQTCPNCIAQGHDLDAKYCKYCGSNL